MHEAFRRTICVDVKAQVGCAVSCGFSMDFPMEETNLSGRVQDHLTTKHVHNTCGSRKFGITIGRLIGLVPDTAQIGDQIYLLLGGQVLYVLRPFERHHRLVGECYIHGLTDGEALE